MANLKLGAMAKAYRNTGTYGTPVWNEMTEVTELSLNLSWDTQDVPRRGQRVKQKKKTLMGLSVPFKHLVIDKPASSDTSDYTAVWDALFADTVLDVLILNGDIATNGVRGVRFDAEVGGGNESQNPGDVLQDELEFVPVPSANDPQAVLIASGAPTFKPLTGDLTEAFA